METDVNIFSDYFGEKNFQVSNRIGMGNETEFSQTEINLIYMGRRNM